MAKLWQKKSEKVSPAVEKFCTGDDWLFDEFLFPYDLVASGAHAKMLCKIGILTKTECTNLIDAMDDIGAEFAKGKIKIMVEDEDCHTVIENELTARLGDAGRKIHTGRSRNDQVLVAFRLFMKDKLDEIFKNTLGLGNQFFAKAKQHKGVAFPGYSHTQQAMPSNLGLYFSAFAEALRDDSKMIGLIKKQIDQNPLGSAAGYGVPLSLDRKMTTKELGFSKIQKNPMYCQNSRGKFESLVMEGLAQLMMTLGRFAADMLFFTSRECNFFKVSDAVVTGSSIMPQKRNIDPMELVRGNSHLVISNHEFVQNLSMGLISGYHRDLQLLKKPVIESFQIVKGSLSVASIVLANIEPNAEEVKRKIMPDIFATNIALDMVKKDGVPFRVAYKRALNSTTSLPSF